MLGLDIAATASRSEAGSATFRAASRSTTGSPACAHLDYLAALSGRPSVRRAELCERLELADADPPPPDPRLLAGHAPEGRHRAGAPARPGARDPRRAVRGPGPADAARVLRRCSTGSGRPGGRSSSAPTSCPRSSASATASPSSAPGRLVAVEDVGDLLAAAPPRVELRLRRPAAGPRRRRRLSSSRSRATRSGVHARGRPPGVPGRDRRGAGHRPRDRAGAPRGRVPRAVRGRGRPGRAGGRCPAGGPAERASASRSSGARGAPSGRGWRGGGALAAWTFLMPVVYATFGRQLASLLETGIVPQLFLRLLGADPFSLVRGRRARLGAPGRDRAAARVPDRPRRGGDRGRAPARDARGGASRPVSRRTLFATLLVAIVAFALLTCSRPGRGRSPARSRMALRASSIRGARLPRGVTPSPCSPRSPPCASRRRPRSTAWAPVGDRRRVLIAATCWRSWARSGRMPRSSSRTRRSTTCDRWRCWAVGGPDRTSVVLADRAGRGRLRVVAVPPSGPRRPDLIPGPRVGVRHGLPSGALPACRRSVGRLTLT